MAIYHIIGEKIRLNEDLGKSFPDSSVFWQILLFFTFLRNLPSLEKKIINFQFYF